MSQKQEEKKAPEFEKHIVCKKCGCTKTAEELAKQHSKCFVKED